MRGTFVKFKPIHVDLVGFLKQFGYFIKLSRLQFSQNDFIFAFSISTLKSPKIKIFSYFEECNSKKFLKAVKYFFISDL